MSNGLFTNGTEYLTTYADLLFYPTFFTTMGYGLLYLLAGTVAAFSVTGDRLWTKVSVALGSMIWGFLCGFIAGLVFFALIAGIYISFPLPMVWWTSMVWGFGLVAVMQLVAVVRRIYVYV